MKYLVYWLKCRIFQIDHEKSTKSGLSGEPIATPSVCL